MGAETIQDWRQTAASALEWWRDAGVDTLVDEDPRDWLARLEPSRAQPSAEPAVTSAPADTLPDTLDAFLAWRVSDAAPEAIWGSPRIAPIGAAGASLMLLLDMPEQEDAASGNLLSGPAGRLLDRMLAAIGHRRESVAIATLAVSRPLTGQLPSEMEPRLAELAQHHIGLIQPEKLLLMGQAASRALLGTDGWANRGSLREVNHSGRNMIALASLHPRFLLERPAAKAESWKHLQLLIGGVRP